MLSDRDKSGRAFVDMQSYLNDVAAAAAAVSEGDVSRAVEVRSDADALGTAFVAMQAYLREMVEPPSGSPIAKFPVRAIPVMEEMDKKRKWQEDEEAREIFSQAKAKADGHPVIPCYAVSDSVADTIVDITATMGVTRLILGAPQRKGLVQMLRDDVVRKVSDDLPEDIHLLVYA